MTRFSRISLLPVFAVLALMLAASVLSACEEQGPAEKAGAAMDKAVDDATRAVKKATE